MTDWTKISETERSDYERKWCKDALEVQDASNIVGVTLSLSDMMREMRVGFRMDEPTIRQHPAVILFGDKLSDMMGRPSPSFYVSAYDSCERISKDGLESPTEDKKKVMDEQMKRIDQPEFDAYSVGICYASVCTSLSVEEAERRLNEEHPTGIPSRWKLSDDKHFKSGLRNGCACAQEPKTHRHWLFSC